MPAKIADPDAYLIERIVFTDGCWEWTGSKRDNGYGSVSRSVFGESCSHRAVYQLNGGTIPEDWDLDHLCRNRGCVNPTHLEPVPHRVNMLRGDTFVAAKAAQTRCAHGHEFTPENTRVRKNGTRNCRTCDRRDREFTNATRRWETYLRRTLSREGR